MPELETVSFIQAAGLRLGAAPDAAPIPIVAAGAGSPPGDVAPGAALSPRSDARLAALANAVRDFAPDLVLLAGDFFDRERAWPATVNRVLSALAGWPPVFLAPGAVDCLSPLGPYSPLERERRGLAPLPENLRVFGPAWQTLFLPGRPGVAVSGRGAGGRSLLPSEAFASCARQEGAPVSLALFNAFAPPPAGEVLARRFAYAALALPGGAGDEETGDAEDWGDAGAGSDALAPMLQVVDGAGATRAAAGRLLWGRAGPDGAAELRALAPE